VGHPWSAAVCFGGGGPARRLGRRARVVAGTAALPLEAGQSCSVQAFGGARSAQIWAHLGRIWVGTGLLASVQQRRFPGGGHGESAIKGWRRHRGRLAAAW
jgi:hypothetical protein